MATSSSTPPVCAAGVPEAGGDGAVCLPRRLMAGVMSGTSADGIDVAFTWVSARVAADDPTRVVGVTLQPVAARTVPWTTDMRQRIQAAATQLDAANLRAVGRLGMDLGRAFGDAVVRVAGDTGVELSEVAAVACHGQTVCHDPPVSTLQLGEASAVAAVTRTAVVADFRVADVAAGGHGAPLASTLDVLLLQPPHSADGWRAVQNIGGIGNVTLLPPADGSASPIAFDTGPGNVLIDFAVQRATDGAATYDDRGAMAAGGCVCEALLADMLALPYLTAPLPKTTGRELYTAALFDKWWERGVAAGASSADIVTTMTEYTAHSIADAYTRYCPGRVTEVLVAGGGSQNDHLLSRLAAALGDGVTVTRHEAVGVSSDDKEALLFALLGYLTLHGLPNNVPACTGAASHVCMGKISLPPPVAGRAPGWTLARQS